MRDGNKLNYEKHQRDYTVLACSEIAEEFFDKRMAGFFSYDSHPIYMLIENGIFYHFVSENDYSGMPINYCKEHNFEDLREYDREMDEKLNDFRKFLDEDHKDIANDILRLNEQMRVLIPIVIIGAYLPVYCNEVGKEMIALSMEIRRKYEDAHRLGMSLQKKLLNKLEAELGIEKDLLQYLTSREFKKFLKDGNLPKNLKDRKGFVFIENFKENEKIFSKEDAFKKLDEIDETRKEINISEFKGNVAFKGIVKGNVKIVRLVEDANLITENDVLVASMTDPRYVFAMKKAAAIVTDEGGITCHAAIVSRELKKPCIIGTKIATQVLKDGDLVEVDADKGIIKILKR